MTLLFDMLIWAHVATGFVGLGAFWIPVFTRKGGISHKRFGNVYAYSAYVVTLSAVVACLWRVATYLSRGLRVADEPEAYGFALFLGYLGVVTFTSVRQSIRAVETRRDPEQLRTPFLEALAVASIAGSVLVILFAVGAWSDVSPILLGLSPIGLFIGARMLRNMRNPVPSIWGGSIPTWGRCWAEASGSTPRLPCSACSGSGTTRSEVRWASCHGCCPPSSASQASSWAPDTTGGNSAEDRPTRPRRASAPPPNARPQPADTM